MFSKTVKKGGFFPLMKWSADELLGLRRVAGLFSAQQPKIHPLPVWQNRTSAMMAMKKSRNRLARFLPRHGRLMVRMSGKD